MWKLNALRNHVLKKITQWKSESILNRIIAHQNLWDEYKVVVRGKIYSLKCLNWEKKGEYQLPQHSSQELRKGK